MPINEQPLQKDCADNVCARCRQPILAGHRVQAAYICTNPDARNPGRITERGLELGIDCVFVHCECRDPYLTGKLSASLRSAP